MVELIHIEKTITKTVEDYPRLFYFVSMSHFFVMIQRGQKFERPATSGMAPR